jgi:serine/threonine protein kinase
MALTRTQLCPVCKHPLPEGDTFCPACAFQGALSLSARRSEAKTWSGPITVATRLPYGPSQERPGEVIGQYRLLEQIGEGGFSSVYVAEQIDPIRRRVALKIIKPGMDTNDVILRFEAERQALALMDHPNIVKVFSAGATDLGRPYFVMELVKGERITYYCDKNSLDTRQRLDLFIRVCSAVQHAHQRGIIHRDLKPSNILVADQDGVGVPKIIDFGIAKAISGQRLTEKALYTEMRQFMGTPAYMSPEQAEMTGGGIDARSDIYTLGVTLYELLTGKTPFDQRELLDGGIEAMRLVIREKEPGRPSSRLTTMRIDELTTTASQRQTDPPKLVQLVRGDLDWIVMKCLEKDRNRRYDSVGGLAMDLWRYLHEEPILARPPSAAYRLKKVLVRNKFVFASASAIAMALVLGIAGATVGLLRAEKQRQLKEAAQQAVSKSTQEAVKSSEAERRARLVASFWQDTMHDFEASVALEQDTELLRETLARATNRLELTLKDQPGIQWELSDAIGDMYEEIGDWRDAEEMHRKAREFRKSVETSTKP